MKNIQKEINTEKGSVLLFCIVILSIMTITFTVLFAMSNDRMISSKKSADVSEYQTIVESSANAYLAEFDLTIQIAKEATNYYINAGYYTKNSPIEFTTELYAEPNNYNAILQNAVTSDLQATMRDEYLLLPNHDEDTVLIYLNNMSGSIYTEVLSNLLKNSVADGNPEGYNKSLLEYRIEDIRKINNQDMITKYGLPDDYSMFTTSASFVVNNTYHFGVGISNKVDASGIDTSYSGVSMFDHYIELQVASTPGTTVTKAEDGSGEFVFEITGTGEDIIVIGWKINPTK